MNVSFTYDVPLCNSPSSIPRSDVESIAPMEELEGDDDAGQDFMEEDLPCDKNTFPDSPQSCDEDDVQGDGGPVPIVPSGGEEEEEEEVQDGPVLTRPALEQVLRRIRDGEPLVNWTRNELREVFCAGFRTRCAAHECSGKAQEVILRFLNDHFRLVKQVRDSFGDKLPCYRTTRRITSKLLGAPKVWETFRWQNGSTVEEQTHQGTCPTFHEGWEPIHESVSVKVKDVIDYHSVVCPMGAPKGVVLSCDGVRENKTGGVTSHILSANFDGCRHVYILYIGRGMNGKPHEHYAPLVAGAMKEMKEAGVPLVAIAGDLPAISEVLMMKASTGTFGCRYCYRSGDRSGKRCDEPTADTGGEFPRDSGYTKKVTWSYTEKEFELRSMETIKAYADLARSNPKGVLDGNPELAGYKGYSPVLDVDDFDAAVQVPADLMHAIYLNLYDRTLKMFFKIGPEQKKVAKAPFTRLPMTSINDRLRLVKVPSEFSRR